MEERLRKFAQIVESGSFTAAAVQLHISQPALSTAIQKLEKELKAQLFISRKPPLRLTAAGQTVYDYTKTLEVRTAALKNDLSAIAGQKQLLRIGMLDSLAQTLFSRTDLLSRIKSQVDFSLTVNNSSTLFRQLKQNKLDAAFVVERNDYPLAHDISSVWVGNEPLVAVARAGDVGTTPMQLLGYDENSYTDRLINDYFLSKRVDVVVSFRSTSQQLLLQLALIGEGVAVLPFDLVKESINAGSLTVIAGVIPRPIILIEHKASRMDNSFKSEFGELSRQLKKLNDELTIQLRAS